MYMPSFHRLRLRNARKRTKRTHIKARRDYLPNERRTHLTKRDGTGHTLSSSTEALRLGRHPPEARLALGGRSSDGHAEPVAHADPDGGGDVVERGLASSTLSLVLLLERGRLLVVLLERVRSPCVEGRVLLLVLVLLLLLLLSREEAGVAEVGGARRVRVDLGRLL